MSSAKKNPQNQLTKVDQSLMDVLQALSPMTVSSVYKWTLIKSRAIFSSPPASNDQLQEWIGSSWHPGSSFLHTISMSVSNIYTISFLYKGWWIHQGHLYFMIYFYFSSIEIQNVSSISLAWPHSLSPCSSRKRFVVPFPTKMNICHPYQRYKGCNQVPILIAIATEKAQ